MVVDYVGLIDKLTCVPPISSSSIDLAYTPLESNSGELSLRSSTLTVTVAVDVYCTVSPLSLT